MAFWNKLTRGTLYPWLFALYPIAYLYSVNRAIVSGVEVLAVAAMTLIVIAVVFFILRAVTKDAHRAGAIVLVIALIFFTYGHIYNLIDSAAIQNLLMPAMIIAGVIISVVIWRSKIDWSKFTPGLNLIAAFLLILPLWGIVSYFIGDLTTASAAGLVDVDKPDVEKVLNDADHPDIYYIILDGYPANALFLRENNYDNSDFTDALEARGFYVAYDSKSNYGTTLLSLPSSLNMRYIDPAENPASPDKLPYLRALLANNQFARELLNRGYVYIDMLSGFTSPGLIADENIAFYPDGPHYFAGSDVDLSDDGGDATRTYIGSVVWARTAVCCSGTFPCRHCAIQEG
jgi:hypothetical protein